MKRRTAMIDKQRLCLFVATCGGLRSSSCNCGDMGDLRVLCGLGSGWSRTGMTGSMEMHLWGR